MTARWKLLAPMFIKPDDHLEASLHEVGAEILFSGTPGRSMEPLNDAARALAVHTPLNGMSRNVLPRRGSPS